MVSRNGRYLFPNTGAEGVSVKMDQQKGNDHSHVLMSHLDSASMVTVETTDLVKERDQIRVSVVIATYNHRNYVLALLEALSDQVEGRFEAVVVDDGSTDGSYEAIVERANELELAGRVLKLANNHGRSVARNVGILNARADIVGITDADCVPSSHWIDAGCMLFANEKIGVVQGPTRPCPDQKRPFFNHFIEIDHFDGSFSTSNIFYRKEALYSVGGFDHSIKYWEDVDLGWRVQDEGWEAVFSPEALVCHQVIPLTPMEWLRWPLHFRYMPAKVARYPAYRRYLFLGIWVHWIHALFDLALISIPLALIVHPAFLLLIVPYIVAFPFQHGLKGRWPPVKAALHLAWDSISFLILLTSSLRHRTLVL
jgi:glycosyltransferase involved in cell wall biosynthesis